MRLIFPFCLTIKGLFEKMEVWLTFVKACLISSSAPAARWVTKRLPVEVPK